MSIFEAAHAARLLADRSTDPAVHRVALALEAGVWCVEREARRLLADEPPIDTAGIPEPPISHIRIEKPPLPSGS